MGISLGECIVIAIVAFIVLGPEKFVDTMERLGRLWTKWQRWWRSL